MSIFRAIALIFFLVMGCSAYSYHPSDSITFYLLRGIGRESGHWGTKVPEAIRQRIPTARFVMMDLPGAGKYHNQTALPTVEKMADFLRDHYLPHQDSTSHRRVILATSLAGNVALEWMTTYPKDFHGAVLISSSFKGVCKSKERVDSKVRRDFIDIFLTQDIAKREKAFLDINSNLNTSNDSLLNAWVELQQQHPVAKSALLKQTLAGMVYTPEITSPSARVLIVGSQADKIVASSCLQNVANALDSKLYLHPTAGHGLPIDAPIWLADTVSSWTLDEVVAFEFEESATTASVPTRSSDHLALPIPSWDAGKVFVKNTSQVTWRSVKSSWKWAENEVLTGRTKDRRIGGSKEKASKDQSKPVTHQEAASG